MKENYKLLSLNEKRNEINKEIRYLLLLINKIVDDPKVDYFNYDGNNYDMSEEEFLAREYEQIIEAKKKLISIFK